MRGKNERTHTHLDSWCPLLKLEGPVGDGGEGDDDEVRAVVFLVLDEVGEQRNGLDRLAQPHLVGQDAVQVVVVQ